MTAVREIKLKCDYGPCADWIMPRTRWVNPGRPQAEVASTVAEARKIARRQGWRTRKVTSYVGEVRTEDRCPRHATL